MRVKIIWFSSFTGIILLVCFYVAVFCVNDTGRERLATSVPRSATEAEPWNYKSARKLHTSATGKNKVSSRRFPDGVVIGVQKGGTRALLKMLSSDSNCIKTAQKLIFSVFTMSEVWNGTYAKCLWLFRKISRVVIEESPSYFHSSKAAERIHTHSDCLESNWQSCIWISSNCWQIWSWSAKIWRTCNQ